MTNAIILIYKIHPFVPVKDLMPKITVIFLMGCSKKSDPSILGPYWKQGLTAATKAKGSIATALPFGNKKRSPNSFCFPSKNIATWSPGLSKMPSKI